MKTGDELLNKPTRVRPFLTRSGAGFTCTGCCGRLRGWNAVITARNPGTLADFAIANPKTALALPLDVTDKAQIETAVSAAKERFGGIDVLVNNAGYGYQSSIEEGEDEQIRAQFDTNVFGLFAVTRLVLPVMRQQRRGHIINVSSVAGFVGFPASGYYAASKHAVEGFSDALAAEVKPLGINVTCVEPGPFRTDWAGRSLKQTPNAIAEYAETAGSRLKGTAEKSGTQAGDPVRAAEAMINVMQSDRPPAHLVLGAFGIAAVTKKLKATLEEIEAWRQVGLDTDYPPSR